MSAGLSRPEIGHISSAGSGPLLVARNLARAFGETRALVDCSFEIGPGEIHALVGENGSGKSTLIKILSGVMQPDTGRLAWSGADVRFAEPAAAARGGIATVFQETLVAEELAVLDNVVLGRERIERGARSRERADARAALDALGLASTALDAPLWTLALAKRQLVTIARALVRPWRLLILDEATSALDIEDRDRLFGLLATARSEGRAVLFVSHRMDEIARIADRVTVLRAGRSIVSLAAADAPTGRLLALMSSAPEEAAAASGRRDPAHRSEATPGPPALVVAGLKLTARARPIDLSVQPGEILGVAGLEGHGQLRLLEAIAGLARTAAGTVTANGNDARAGRRIETARQAASAGIAYVPRDRKRDGLFLPLSILDNLMLPSLARFATLGVLRRGPLVAAARAIAARLQVRATSLAGPVGALSGGNQQKVLLGRWIATSPRVLLLNDPMRGVDGGTKRELYDVLRAMATGGAALILLSTELPELCLLCDRVAVMREYGLETVVERVDLNERALIEAMFGHRAAAVDAPS